MARNRGRKYMNLRYRSFQLGLIEPIKVPVSDDYKAWSKILMKNGKSWATKKSLKGVNQQFEPQLKLEEEDYERLQTDNK